MTNKRKMQRAKRVGNVELRKKNNYIRMKKIVNRRTKKLLDLYIPKQLSSLGIACCMIGTMLPESRSREILASIASMRQCISTQKKQFNSCFLFFTKGVHMEEKQKLRVFLSFGMHGKTKEEIKERRDSLFEESRSRYYREMFYNRLAMDVFTKDKYDIEFVDNCDADGSPEDGRLHYLGQAIQKLDKVDAVIFAKDWHEHKGCVIEHDVAELYKIPILID